jgi:hypothetical protein
VDDTASGLAAVLPDRYRRFAGALRSFSRLGSRKLHVGHVGPSAGRGRKWGSREESTVEATGVGAARGGARLRGGLDPHGEHLVFSRGRCCGPRPDSNGALPGGLALPAPGEVIREEQDHDDGQDQQHREDHERHYRRPSNDPCGVPDAGQESTRPGATVASRPVFASPSRCLAQVTRAILHALRSLRRPPLRPWRV